METTIACPAFRPTQRGGKFCSRCKRREWLHGKHLVRPEPLEALLIPLDRRLGYKA